MNERNSEIKKFFVFARICFHFFLPCFCFNPSTQRPIPTVIQFRVYTRVNDLFEILRECVRTVRVTVNIYNNLSRLNVFREIRIQNESCVLNSFLHCIIIIFFGNLYVSIELNVLRLYVCVVLYANYECNKILTATSETCVIHPT